jgi:hypothetical protein
MLKSVILFALIAALACGSSPTRSAVAVETKFDRFSSVTTIVMNLQEVIDNRDLTLRMSLEYKTGGDAAGNGVKMSFEGESAARLDFPDSELYFLADGASVISEMFVCTPLGRKIDIAACTTFISPLRLDRIAESKRVEMKFGNHELEINPQLLPVLREFMGRVKEFNKDGLPDGIAIPLPIAPPPPPTAPPPPS